MTMMSIMVSRRMLAGTVEGERKKRRRREGRKEKEQEQGKWWRKVVVEWGEVGGRLRQIETVSDRVMKATVSVVRTPLKTLFPLLSLYIGFPF